MSFKNLILLVGDNVLATFIVAEYFLQTNQDLQKIWLISAGVNNHQTGFFTQVKNLEKLIQRRWEGKHKSLRIPLSKIILSNIQNPEIIENEITKKVINQINLMETHFDYSGGDRMTAIHVCSIMEKARFRKQRPFSWINWSHHRLLDEDGAVEKDLTKKIKLSFEDLVTLQDLLNCRKNNTNNLDFLKKCFQVLGLDVSDGDRDVRGQKWKRSKFNFDLVAMKGYQLFVGGNSNSAEKKEVKVKALEMFLRSCYIGGDITKMIIVSELNLTDMRVLQEELDLETSTRVLVLGQEDQKNKTIFHQRVEEFVG